MKSDLATTPKISIPTAFKELFEPHRYKVYWGGRGAGKSVQFASALLLAGSRERTKAHPLRQRDPEKHQGLCSQSSSQQDQSPGIVTLLRGDEQ